MRENRKVTTSTMTGSEKKPSPLFRQNESGAGKPEIKLEEALGYNVYRTALLFRRELMRALSQYNMTPEQWQVMATLWSGVALTQSEIVRLTLKDKPTVSRMIKRLERNGWVEIKANPKDGRSSFIQPTAKGWRLQGEVPQKLIRHFEPLRKGLTRKDEGTLMALLKKIRRILGDEFVG